MLCACPINASLCVEYTSIVRAKSLIIQFATEIEQCLLVVWLIRNVSHSTHACTFYVCCNRHSLSPFSRQKEATSTAAV